MGEDDTPFTILWQEKGFTLMFCTNYLFNVLCIDLILGTTCNITYFTLSIVYFDS